MNTVLNWKKGVFSCNYKLMESGKAIGFLKGKSFGQSAEGEVFGNRYGFNTYGVFRKETEILDGKDGAVIGKVKFDCWMPKAKIELGDKTYFWKFKNIWETRWEIYDEAGTQISFCGHSMKGKAVSADTEEVLNLAGLFISNFYWEMSGIFIAVITPTIFIF